ncbi:MAG: hypothetical protein Q9217_002955 [Psora testacea]
MRLITPLYIPFSFALFLASSSLTAADTTESSPPLYTSHLYSLPPSPNPSPYDAQPLATLTYNPQYPHLSRLESFTPPPNTTDLTSILVFPPSDNNESESEGKGEKYISSSTATRGFHAPYKGRFSLHVSLTGQVLGVSYPSFEPSAAITTTSKNGKGNKGAKNKDDNARGEFDLVLQKNAPGVFLEKANSKAAAAGGRSQGAGVKIEDGGGEETEGEKTFFQK